MAKLPQIEAFKDLIQEGIDRTVDGVESIHQTILDFPFAAVENNEAINDKLKTVRRLKTNAVSSVYDMIRKINNEVGETISDLIGTVEDHADAQEGIARAGEKLNDVTADLQEEAIKVKENVKKEAAKLKESATKVKESVEKDVAQAQKVAKKKAASAKNAAKKTVNDVKKNVKAVAEA